VRLRSLGDSILTLPLVEALAEQRPDLELDVLVETPFAPVFAGHPAVSSTLRLRPRDGGEGWSRLRAVREIRRRRYPAVLNLHGGSTSLLLTLASGAPLRIGQESFRHPWAYNVRIPPASSVWQRSGIHTVEHQLTLLRWLGMEVPAERRPRLPVSAGARGRVRERLRQSGLEPGGYFLIQPTATLATKQWPEERFASLADRLAAESGSPIVFTAARRDAAVLRAIEARAALAHHYWSDLDLEELFALVEGCQLFVGNDSGPTHAAAALGRPIVVVWGSSSHAAWRPWGTDYEMVRSELPCMPCAGYRCEAFGEPRCILDIEVERVMQACRALRVRAATARSGLLI
jgi:lipopolysaccharide heptosyltransferase II